MTDEQSARSDEDKDENSAREGESNSLKDLEESGSKLPIEFLNDVPMKLTVELGVGDISLRELLQLGHGAVFELDKLAGEPLEVKVNDRLISRGEVVVVNDRYAIRLTDVINPDEIN